MMGMGQDEPPVTQKRTEERSTLAKRGCSSIIWKTVFEPIGAERLDARALARHHADLMLHALRPLPVRSVS